MGSGKDGFWTKEEWGHYSEEVRRMQEEGWDLRGETKRRGWCHSSAEISEKKTDEECEELARDLQAKQKGLSDIWGYEKERLAMEADINRRQRRRDDDV